MLGVGHQAGGGSGRSLLLPLPPPPLAGEVPRGEEPLPLPLLAARPTTASWWAEFLMGLESRRCMADRVMAELGWAAKGVSTWAAGRGGGGGGGGGVRAQVWCAVRKAPHPPREKLGGGSALKSEQCPECPPRSRNEERRARHTLTNDGSWSARRPDPAPPSSSSPQIGRPNREGSLSSPSAAQHRPNRRGLPAPSSSSAPRLPGLLPRPLPRPLSRPLPVPTAPPFG